MNERKEPFAMIALSQVVRLWVLDLSGFETPAPEWLAVLDDGERAQLSRFVQAKDRLSYAAAHALLRRSLGSILGVSSKGLMMQRDTRGKPFLAEPQENGLEFSLSHTEGLVAVAVSEAGEVGVDVEKMERNILSQDNLAVYGLSQAEVAEIALISESERKDVFFDLWTAREAVAKADGRGLSLPFDRIRIDRNLSSAVIEEEAGGEPSRWRLWRERPSASHRLSLATRQHATVIRMDS